MRRLIDHVLWILAAQLSVAPLVHATQITIANLDGAVEGFNDPTPVTPVGTNPGTTIGEQRLIVFEYAARIWESIVDSSVEIIVEAKFDPLTCTTTSAILGSAGATNYYRDFANAPVSETWYSVAQANSLAGSDLNPASADVSATFNASIDNNDNCLSNTNWYYGLDGNKPANSIELLSVVMHEIGHGLGFLTLVDLATGMKAATRNDAYMLNLEDHSRGQTWDQLNNVQRAASATDTADLHWIGSNVTSRIGSYTGGVNNGHIRMYAPGTVNPGSSVSHFSNALAPNELMEPFDTGPKPGPGLAQDLLLDIGWGVFPDSRPVVSTLANASMLQEGTLQIDFVIADNDTPLGNLVLDATSSNTTVVDQSGLVFSGSGNVRTLTIGPNPGAVGATTIEISVWDGSSTATESFALSVLFNNPPVVGILSPLDSDSFAASDVISFQATATDAEDGSLSSAVQWDSSLDGNIGSGAIVMSTLSPGTHTITATATDSLGKSTSQSVDISVAVQGDSDGDGLDDSWEIAFFGDLSQNGAGDYDSDGLSNLDEATLMTTPTLPDSDGDGISDGDEVHLYAIDPTFSNRGDVAPRGASDNLIGVGDLVVITRLITGVITPDALESTLADMNDDGRLDAADILMLQQLLLAVPAP